MAEMITRCPKCETAFRITPAHLKSAKGSVRCGSCLQVFNAKENLVATSAHTTEPASAPEPSPAARPPGIPTKAPATAAAPPPRDAHDDVLISDDMDPEYDDDLLDPDVFIGEDRHFLGDQEAAQTSLFENTRRAAKSTPDEDEEETAEDESWALKLLDEDDADPTETSAGASETFDTEADFSHDWRELPSDDWAETAKNRTEADAEEAEAVAGADAYANNDDDSLTEEETAAAAGDNWQDSSEVQHPPLRATRHDAMPNSYLDAIEPEPVEFAYRVEKPFWHKKLLWSCLSLLALIVLIGQIAWLQYPALNRIEPYRSVYSIACGFIGCQLPDQEDASAIHASNLVVRSHPRVDNALMVDVVLQNTAPFRQAFPQLALTFNDLQGKLVAERVFTPHEYLGGELAGQDVMPVDQPIHIALEIVDPGRNAVNYRIRIVSGTP